ncbi:MAG: filamentous hemagglutinin N-terminal domain-containing protein, partial [Rhodoferax sp.]|uniref:two-partner secretion domain-containing protein n=1 Tax=Rhodoferax sp. TaxID=50421 RepID=UPI00301B2969
MNKVYRLVWDALNNTFVAVAENVKGRGKPTSSRVGSSHGVRNNLLAAIGAVFPIKVLCVCIAFIGSNAFAAPPVNALPTGGQITAGQSSISQSGSTMSINQASQQTAINWSTFNIGAAAQVNFIQPNASSVALNRVLSADPSAIYGKLTANGQVFLLNPNGVLFGAGSRVDVGGLVASSMKLSDADFMAGNYRFTKDGSGSVINQGTMTARAGGYLALLAPTVENEGILSANLGTVALAAGDAITLNMGGDSLISVKVEQASVDTLVRNKQLIQADGGQVFLTASAAQSLVNQAVPVPGNVAGQMVTVDGVTRLVTAAVENTGTIQARSIPNAVGQVQVGAIAMLANATNGVVTTSGTLDASSATHNAGSVTLTAADVRVLSGARIDATGATGGGVVLVGGEAHGAGTLAHAQTVTIEAGAVVDVSATQTGKGGTAVVWSDSATVMDGTILARGGQLGGDGGWVETSGRTLNLAGTVNAGATHGRNGEWLLDPNDLTIAASGSSVTGGTTYQPGTTGTILNSSINTALNAGSNVTIATSAAGTGGSGNITVSAAITANSNTAATTAANSPTLTLLADGSITIGANIDIRANFLAKANANITDTGGYTLKTYGQDVTLNSRASNAANGSIGISSATILSNGGNISLYGGSSFGGNAI